MKKEAIGIEGRVVLKEEKMPDQPPGRPEIWVPEKPRLCLERCKGALIAGLDAWDGEAIVGLMFSLWGTALIMPANVKTDKSGNKRRRRTKFILVS